MKLPDLSKLNLPEPVAKGLWFVGLWVGGVVTVTVVAYGIRALIIPS